MTPEEIKALIESTLQAQLPTVLKGAFSEFNDHFEERLKEYQAPSVQPEVDTNDPLAKRLANLEKQLKEAQDREQARIKEAEELHFGNVLKDALASKGSVLHQGLVSKLLGYELRNGAVQKDGEWYTKDGLKLSEAVDKFFSTPEGLHFLPSNHQNGTATPTHKQPQGNQPVSTKDLSLDDMLADSQW